MLLSILLVFYVTDSSGQTAEDRRAVFSVSGYLKEMPWITINRGEDHSHISNLVHNRINLLWKPSPVFSARLEIRSRYYRGDEGLFSPLLSGNNSDQWMNLTAEWSAGPHHFFVSEVDRGVIEFRKAQWVMAAGRQRINWGVNSTWNPNDIFNSYRLFDFDYEERPGSDAVAVRYSRNALSHVEAVASRTGVQAVLAGKYLTHWKGNDIQFIGGYYKNKFTLGAGWAGNWGKFGCKGELQFYDNPADTTDQVNVSAEIDRIFKGNYYLSFGALYNRNGIGGAFREEALATAGLSPENLMPFRWNLILHAAREVNLLVNVRASLIYSPGSDMLFLLPSLNYSLRPNLDLDVFGQSYFRLGQQAAGLSHAGYLRLKWSF